MAYWHGYIFHITGPLCGESTHPLVTFELFPSQRTSNASFDFFIFFNIYNVILTHWGRVTHIRVSNLTIIGSDNVLSPDLRQAIIWTNAGILLIQTLGTNFS